ncbi:MAG: SAM-dependent methyltransferase [Geminicoccaceae bacterium]
MQDRLSKLATSANALIAIGLALKAKLRDETADLTHAVQVEQVIDALGLSDSIDSLTKTQASAMLANIRSDLLLGVQVLSDDPIASQWAHDNPELLQSFGEVSAGFPTVLESKIAAELDGLLDRLNAPGAKFLDVGVGVAELSIAMVRKWPSLQVLGVDPWGPSLAIGSENLRKAGLADQIDLREAPAETLSETEEFDLAWIPSAFIPRQSLPIVLKQVGKALKPGGWLLLARPHFEEEPLARATAHLRTVLWGGLPLSADDAQVLLGQSGFADVRSVIMPPGAPIAVTAARAQ